jgi:hypothetical protein
MSLSHYIFLFCFFSAPHVSVLLQTYGLYDLEHTHFELKHCPANSHHAVGLSICYNTGSTYKVTVGRAVTSKIC